MKHVSVMTTEVLEVLNPKEGEWYLDATLGAGGHTAALLEKGARVLAFDQDSEAIEHAQTRFATQVQARSLVLQHENFSKIENTVGSLQKTSDIGTIRGVLFDFGTSTEQIMSSERGFSFEGDGPLDMRMDTKLGVQAKDILAVVPEKQLAELFATLGGEQYAKKIARAIKKNEDPITTTAQLSGLVARVKPKKGKLHPATKVFQALRIAVNSELEHISAALPQAWGVLEPGGTLVTIAFHEGEDRIAKQYLKMLAKSGAGSVLKKIKPSERELARNPRARSAILRTIQKVHTNQDKERNAL